MTYVASEQSKHDGKPIELFRYVGTYQTFRYTSSQAPIDFQAPDEVASHTYLPLNMKRSGFNNATQNDDNAEITIDMPVSTDIVAIYGFQISPPALELTIFRGHNPGEFVQAWNGDVENISVVKGTATIRVPSKLAAALSADFPNVYYQGPCNHNLFDARCGIDIADWSATQEISVIDGKEITLDDMPDALDGKLIGGDAILTSGERRMITLQIGPIITINYPFAGAVVGDNLILAAGCDLAYLGDCDTKFNNTERFGGFPFIPPKNIFNGGLEPGKDVADASCLPDIFNGVYWSIEVYIEATATEIPSFNLGIPLTTYRPNPGGKIMRDLSSGFAGGGSFWSSDIYEYDTPNPYDGLNGQILEKGYFLSNTHFRRDFYYPYPSSGYRGVHDLQLQYSHSSISHLTPNPATLHFSIYGGGTTGSIGTLFPYSFYASN